MGFKQAFMAEGVKFRRSPVWLAFVVMLVLSAFMGTVNYQANVAVLTQGWVSLWTQHTLFSCAVFLPAALGVLCAWQWRLEHTDHSWNQIMAAPLGLGAIWWAKLCWAGVIALGTAVIVGLFYIVGGVLIGLPLGDLPPELPGWLFFGFLGMVAICAWEEFIAMVIRIFAVPVAIGLFGGIVGLYITAKGFGLYWPWALLSLGMRANNPNLELAVAPFLLLCLVFTLIPGAIALGGARVWDVRSE